MPHSLPYLLELTIHAILEMSYCQLILIGIVYERPQPFDICRVVHVSIDIWVVFFCVAS